MSNVSGVGTVWNLPNYEGMLYTADQINSPFLSMIGGLNGGRITTNFEFATGSAYAHEALIQESITETASLTAPTAINYVRTQEKNVCQLFHEAINISYVNQINGGRLSGINTAGAQNNVISQKDFQIAKAVEAVARKVNYHFLNGSYSLAGNAGQANQTRGMIELCTVNTVDASSAALSKALIDALLLEMYSNGAQFKQPVIWCNGFQKIKISDIYGYQPMDRNIGGVAVDTIVTDFGVMGVKLDRFMPTGTILIADMAEIAPVFQEFPDNKGILFYEDLAKTGMADKGQVCASIGLAHGASINHGTIVGLATA